MFASGAPPHPLIADNEPTSIATVVIAIAGVLGATGLAGLLKVWLENRRLLKKDYRKTMADRITELEAQVKALYATMGDLREENGRLEQQVRDCEERAGEADSR